MTRENIRKCKLYEYLCCTLHQSASIMWQWPGEGDGAGGDLADPDGGGHGGPDHGHHVADAVLAMTVLHSAHHTRETLPHGDNQQWAITQHLVVVIVMDQFVTD